MENHTEIAGKEHLSKTVDKLTEENQRRFLGVLETLTFAQNVQGKNEPKRGELSAAYPA